MRIRNSVVLASISVSYSSVNLRMERGVHLVLGRNHFHHSFGAKEPIYDAYDLVEIELQPGLNALLEELCLVVDEPT